MANVKICTLDEFKVYAGIASTDTTYDTLLQVYINAITDIFNSYCWRVFGEVKTVTQLMDIEGEYEDRVILKYFPVITVTAVTDNYDIVAKTGSALVEGSDYFVYKSVGEIRCAPESYFSQGLQKLKVNYTAGSSTVADEIKFAAYMQIQYMWKNARGSEGKISETIGDYSYDKAEVTSSLLPEVRSILDMHRKIGL